jgi:hypothetical protein
MAFDFKKECKEFYKPARPNMIRLPSPSELKQVLMPGRDFASLHPCL